MKRLVSFLLVLTLLCVPMLLISCDSESDDPNANSSNGSADNNGSDNQQNGGQENGDGGNSDDSGNNGGGDNSTPDDKIRVLFIGNSFTHYNSMPTNLFWALCSKAGLNVSVDTVTNGGHYLYEFADETDEYGKQVRQKLSSKSYDVVILQEQSGAPVSNPPLFYYGARILADLVKQNGAELWYYQTWGYKSGYSKLPTHGGTTEIMEMKLRAAYSAIAEETGGKLVHAGVAMLDIHQNTSINVYNADKFHPSLEGSALVAYTMLAEIFGIDPRAVDYDAKVSAETATKLKEAAYKAAFEEHPVSEEYKTSSVGVTVGKNGNSSDIDNSKTVSLKSLPTSQIISYITRSSLETGNGWVLPLKGDQSFTFSGIRGDKDKIASSEWSATGLTDAQKADIADIGYGVSVIGIERMNSDVKGYTTSVENLVNGHWGSSYMAGIYFGEARYDISGVESEEGEFSGLITLNFGDIYTFDAIGWLSGSMKGFPQIQKVYVSDDGVNWTLVESACYDTVKLEASGSALTGITSSKLSDPWNQNKASAQALFSMGGVSGKYIRIGVIAGRASSSTSSSITINLDGVQDINTREIIVYGAPKADNQ